MSPRSFARAVILLTIAPLVGCSGPAASTGDAGAGGAGSGGNGGSAAGVPAEPRVRFFVDERPWDAADEELEASEARWGDPIRIVAEGLGAKASVRIDVSTGAWGTFVADETGTVDLGRDAPLMGSWSSADIDGPFWSAPVADAPIFDVNVAVSDVVSGTAIVQGAIHRRPVNVGVEATKVNEGTRVGTLSRPPQDGTKRPAILTFGGSEGGTWAGEFMAYYMSQLGYVAFGVGYFGAPGLPSQLDKVPIEILADDLDYLASQPDVDPDRIAVLGASRGGELALILGAAFPGKVRAVIAQAPSGYVWGAVSGADASAWTLGGEQIPYVPSSGALADIVTIDGKDYWVTTPTFYDDIEAASPDALAAARTPVEATNGPVFLLAGKDDQLWPSCALADVAWQGLVSGGHIATYDDEFHCYPDAGHFITFPPGSSTLESTSYYHPTYKVWFLTGGTPQGIAAAERQGNTDMRRFLQTAFGE